MSPVIDTDKADIVDTSHLDAALNSVRQNEENARRRAMVMTWSKAVLIGGVGVAAIIAATGFWLQPWMTQKFGGSGDKPIVAEHDRMATPKTDAPVEKKWDELTDKKYEGVITAVSDYSVCWGPSRLDCIGTALIGPDHKAILDANGRAQLDPSYTFLPMMQKWIGYQVYSAKDPDDPDHLSDYWVRDGDKLIKFEMRKKDGGGEVKAPDPAPLPKVAEEPKPKPNGDPCANVHFPARVSMGTATWQCDGQGHGTFIEPTKVAEAPKPDLHECPPDRVVEGGQGKDWCPPTKTAEAPKPDPRCYDANDGWHCPLVQKDFDGRPLYIPPVKSLPPPQPAPSTETHKWDQLADKQYVGIITDVPDGRVCYDHNTAICTYAVKMDVDGHIVADSNNHAVPDPDIDFSPMVKWIGYSAYKAHRPGEPDDSAIYWVADHGMLIRFEAALKGQSNVIRLRSDGMSLLLDVGLGEMVRPFVLDTGASSMTVTADVAAELVSAGHADPNGATAVTYADGTTHTVQTVTIDAVKVGTHVLRNVPAMVTPSGAPMLLGLDVLKAIGKFEVDAPHRTLTFNGGAS
jgi:clan AA aspartic protease (TIGR02281 family)